MKLSLSCAALAICISVRFSCPVDASAASQSFSRVQFPHHVRSNLASIKKSAHAAAADSENRLVECSWERNRFPLRVYFAPIAKEVWRYKPNYPKIMRRAFQAWTEATGRTAQFRFVESLPAEIQVVYVNETKRKRQGTARLNCYIDVMLQNVVIQLAINKNASEDEVLHVGEHEIGHSLGLMHSKHKGVMNVGPVIGLEFISADDVADFKRIYKLDADFHPLMLNAEDIEKYRIELAEALRKFYQMKILETECQCDFTFEVDTNGHIYNPQVSRESPLYRDVLTTISRAEPLPRPPSYFCDHLLAKGVLSSSGILEVRELQPCK